MPESPIITDSSLHWYAAKIHYRSAPSFAEFLSSRGVKTYIAKKVLSNVVFIHTTEERIKRIKADDRFNIYMYNHVGGNEPQVIPDREMEVFIIISSAGDEVIDLGSDAPFYHEGQKVRVIDGIFKGAEGVVKRIKGDRRLIVAVSGVAAVATSYIPPQFLEKIED